MTLRSLKEKLVSTGLPVAYRDFPEGEAPDLPYICYLCTDNDPLFADGTVYYDYDNVRVELYTAYKDPNTEALVEAALTDYHWKKDETYIDTERCYLIIYEIEV